MDNYKIEIIRIRELIDKVEALPDEPKNDPNLLLTFAGPQLLLNCIEEATNLSKDCFGENNVNRQNLDKINKLKYNNAKNALLFELIDMERTILGFNSSEEKSFSLDWTKIHSVIVDISKDRFEKGFFADSVESAFKEINTRVKKIVKDKMGNELDGSDLMFKAFNPKDPIIILDDLSTRSGMDIQQGYMYLFAGAIMAARNPKAHEVITISRERATHYIALASLLMHKLDEMK